MSIFRAFWHFIELLIVINLITISNNRPDYIWIIIFLAITKSLLRSKMPNFLLFLQCVRIIKSGFRRYWPLFHSSNNIFKNQFKQTSTPPHTCFPKETNPYFLRYVNHVAYFFTQAVDYSDSQGGDSSDDEDSQKESQHSENQEILEENSDPECEISLNDIVETTTDIAKVPCGSSSVTSTPQKRKAESELVKNIKRSKSVDALNDTVIESDLSLQLERDSQTKDSEQKEVKHPPRIKIEGSHSHESQDSLQEAAKSSSTSEGLNRIVSFEKRLQDQTTTSSTLIQTFDRLSTELFTSDETGLSQGERESYFHKKFRSSEPCMLESKDSSKSKDSVQFHRTKEKGKSADKESDNKMHQLPVSNSSVTGETSKQVSVIKTFIPPVYSVSDSSVNTEEISEISDRSINVESNTQNKMRVVDAPKPDIFFEGLCQRLAETSREFFASSNERSYRIVNIYDTNETKELEESSLENACPHEYRNNNIESAEVGSEPSDSWNRAGPSSEPEWFSSYPYERDGEFRRPKYYRPYPGLTLHPLRAKKDAHYQKKFYKEKKEIVLPVKSGKRIRWSINVSKKLAHKVPEITNSEEEKLPLHTYHELAQNLAEGFITAYNKKKMKKIKYLKEEKKKKQEKQKKQKKHSKNAGYVKSSFQGESPPRDNSDDDYNISLDSQESVISSLPSTPTRSRPPSESDLTEIYVSPLKPIASVSQPVSAQRRVRNVSPVDFTQSKDMNRTEISVDISKKKYGEPKPVDMGHVYDYGDYSSDHFPVQPIRIKFFRGEDLTEDLGNPRRLIFYRDNFSASHTKDGTPLKLKAFIEIKEVVKLAMPCWPLSVEEFLSFLFQTQRYYYQTLYDESNLFDMYRNTITRCVIPMRHSESVDDDYELVGDTLQRSSSRSEQTLRSLDSTSSNITDSRQQTQSSSYMQENLNVDMRQFHRLTSETDLPTFDTPTFDDWPISEMIEESGFSLRSFDIATNLEEPKDTLSAETSREGDSSAKSLNQQFQNFDPSKTNLSDEFLSKISFEDANERRSILETLSESLNESSYMSIDDQRGVQENFQVGSISEENLEIFEDEQRAILESLSTSEDFRRPSHSTDNGDIRDKQCESLVVPTEGMHDEKLRVQQDFVKSQEFENLPDSEYQGIPSPTMVEKSTPKFNISEDKNLPEETSTGDTLLESEKGKVYPSSCAEYPSTDVTTSDSIKQETEDSPLPSSSSTQMPVIIHVRGNVDPEREHTESSSDISNVGDEDKSVFSKQSHEDKS